MSSPSNPIRAGRCGVIRQHLTNIICYYVNKGEQEKIAAEVIFL